MPRQASHRPSFFLMSSTLGFFPTKRILMSIGVVTLFAIGCSSEQAAPASSDQNPTEDPSAVTSGDTQVVEAAGLRFTLPSGWDREQPSSSMRAAQASIHGSGGDGQLSVFFFGAGGGGSVDANLNRWVGQVQGADVEPLRDQFETGDFLVTTVSHSGTLKASTMGTFPTTDQPDYTLLAAVVEGPGGPWFFKAVGPKVTMQEQQPSFRAMLEAIGG